MAGAIDWVLTMQQDASAKETTDEAKKRAHRRFPDAVLALSKAFALAAASDEGEDIRDEVGFFQATEWSSMDDDAERAFWIEIDPGGGHVDPVRAVQTAIDLGIAPGRAISLSLAVNYRRFMRTPAKQDGLAPLQALISHLMEPVGSRVFEFTTSDEWLSLASSGAAANQLTLMSPLAEMADVLRIAAPGANIKTGWPTAESAVGELTEFDLVICAPPIGMPTKGEADGFGGEIFRQMIGRTAKDGRALWLTSRGVHFAPRAQRTKEALARAGWMLDAAAEIRHARIASMAPSDLQDDDNQAAPGLGEGAGGVEGSAAGPGQLYEALRTRAAQDSGGEPAR
jgi:hypothetical protein